MSGSISTCQLLYVHLNPLLHLFLLLNFHFLNNLHLLFIHLVIAVLLFLPFLVLIPHFLLLFVRDQLLYNLLLGTHHLALPFHHYFCHFLLYLLP